MNAANRRLAMLALLVSTIVISTSLLTSTEVAFGYSEGATASAVGIPIKNMPGKFEPTCFRCHKDGPAPVANKEIAISLVGPDGAMPAPETYKVNTDYKVSITLTNPALVKVGHRTWGFKAAAVETLNTDLKAGTLNIPPTDPLLQKTDMPQPSGGTREYVTHKLAGISAKEMGMTGMAETTKSWTFSWKSPPARDVTFYFAGIAGNNDKPQAKLTGDIAYFGSTKPLKPVN